MYFTNVLCTIGELPCPQPLVGSNVSGSDPMAMTTLSSAWFVVSFPQALIPKNKNKAESRTEIFFLFIHDTILFFFPLDVLDITWQDAFLLLAAQDVRQLC